MHDDRQRWGKADQVAFRVVEPGGLRAANLGDPIDGLERRSVVLFEPDAFCLEVFDRLLDVLYLEHELGVRPGGLAAGGVQQKAGPTRLLVHDETAHVLGGRQPQLVAIERLRPLEILRWQHPATRDCLNIGDLLLVASIAPSASAQELSIKCLIESEMTPATATHPVRSHKEDRQQALVLAAFNQIAERGFEGLRTREVAAGLRLDNATPHHYFPPQEAPVLGGVAPPPGRLRPPPTP